MISENLTSFSQDKFNRKKIAENLTRILEPINNSVILSLDSDWGTGKTTFVTMWKDMLDTEAPYKDKFNTLYFNAWENDYIKDPLLAIFSEIESQIESQIKKDDSELKKQFDNVKDKMKPLVKLSASTGLKILTAGILNLEQIDFGNFNESQLIELAGKLGDASIKELSASKNIRTEFKNELSTYNDLSKCQDGSNKKTIFFIDELDRCRPTFAIELLEVIKHLFNIDNFIFVISIDKEQLSHSVSTIYGQGMDTNGYLKRFFNLDYRLPKIDIRQYADVKNESILRRHSNTQYLEVFLKELFRIENFSLRDIDRTYYYLELLLPLIKEFNIQSPSSSHKYHTHLMVVSYIYSILILTKIKKDIVYKQILNANYIIDPNYDKVDNILNNFPVPNFSVYSNNIGDLNPEEVHELVSTITRKFLTLNLITNNTRGVSDLNNLEYTIGFPKEHKYYVSGVQVNLLEFFKDDDSNILSKLEFIDGFN